MEDYRKSGTVDPFRATFVNFGLMLLTVRDRQGTMHGRWANWISRGSGKTDGY